MSFERYGFHDLVEVLVDEGLSPALRASIDFQIGYFRGLRGRELRGPASGQKGEGTGGDEPAAPVRLRIVPFARAAAERPSECAVFHLSLAAAGRFLEAGHAPVGLRWEAEGLTLYLEGGSGAVMVALQLLLVPQEVTFVHAAGLADRQGRVILLPGGGGVGKTAILGGLVRTGEARLLGDDLLTLGADGRVRAVPRAFVLKDYHRTVFPEVFAQRGIGRAAARRGRSARAQRVIDFIYNNAPFMGLTKAVLRRAGLLGPVRARVSTRAEPAIQTVPVEELFGPEAVALEGPLREAVFLERYEGEDFRFTAMDQAALVRRMFAIIHHEWADHMRTILQLGAMELVDLPAYFDKVRAVMARATADRPAHLLQIPRGASPEALATFFRSKVDLA